MHHPLMLSRDCGFKEHRPIPTREQAESSEPHHFFRNLSTHLRDSQLDLARIQAVRNLPGDQSGCAIRVGLPNFAHWRRFRTAVTTPTTAHVVAATPPTTDACCSGVHGSPKLTARVSSAGVADRQAVTAMLMRGLICGACSNVSAACCDDVGPLSMGGVQDHTGCCSKVVGFGKPTAWLPVSSTEDHPITEHADQYLRLAAVTA